jgi:general secretion pathway protein M
LTLTSTIPGAPSRSQTLAVLAYFSVVIALLAASLWFISDLVARSGDLAAAEERLQQLTQRSQPRQPAPNTSDPKMSGSPFLEARTITIAGAALEQRVGAAVTKAGGALLSSQVGLDGPEAANGFVSLTASMEAAQPALQTILYDIEAGMPYLFVEKLSIQSPEDPTGSENGRMRMTMSVVGQWRPPE